jgi:hypothetical protein
MACWNSTLGTVLDDCGAVPTLSTLGAQAASANLTSWSAYAPSAFQATLTSTNFGTFTAGLTSKATPVGADIVPLSDSAASGAEKGLSWTNLLAGVLSYIQGGNLNLGSNSLSAGSVNIGAAGLAPAEILVAATGSLTANQMGSGIANNYGQTVANTQTLPACAANLRKTFIVGTSGMGAFNIKPAGSNVMILDGITLTAAHKASDATPVVGDYLSCYSFQTGASAWEWICATGSCTWTDGGL